MIEWGQTLIQIVQYAMVHVGLVAVMILLWRVTGTLVILPLPLAQMLGFGTHAIFDLWSVPVWALLLTLPVLGAGVFWGLSILLRRSSVHTPAWTTAIMAAVAVCGWVFGLGHYGAGPSGTESDMDLVYGAASLGVFVFTIALVLAFLYSSRQGLAVRAQALGAGKSLRAYGVRSVETEGYAWVVCGALWGALAGSVGVPATSSGMMFNTSFALALPLVVFVLIWVVWRMRAAVLVRSPLSLTWAPGTPDPVEGAATDARGPRHWAVEADIWHVEMMGEPPHILTVKEEQIVVTYGGHDQLRALFWDAPASDVVQEMYMDQDIRTLDMPGRLERGIACMTCASPVVMGLSAEQVILLTGHVRTDQSGLHRDVDKVWRLVPDLRPYAHARAADLPAGAQMRLALAATIVSKPRFLVVDATMADISVPEVAHMCRMLNRSYEVSLLILAHVDDVWSTLADRVYD